METTINSTVKDNLHVCPWWMGYILISPFRRFRDNPETLLRPHVEEGMTVLDVGCAMGYYSIPLARMAGETGRVICVDLQKRMIKTLVRRAKNRGLEDRIETRVCGSTSLCLGDLAGQVDFVLASGVAHEVPDRVKFFEEIQRVLKRGGKIMVREPAMPVSEENFRESCQIAEETGLVIENSMKTKSARTAIFRKAAIQRY